MHQQHAVILAASNASASRPSAGRGPSSQNASPLTTKNGSGAEQRQRRRARAPPVSSRVSSRRRIVSGPRPGLRAPPDARRPGRPASARSPPPARPPLRRGGRAHGRAAPCRRAAAAAWRCVSVSGRMRVPRPAASSMAGVDASCGVPGWQSGGLPRRSRRHPAVQELGQRPRLPDGTAPLQQPPGARTMREVVRLAVPPRQPHPLPGDPQMALGRADRERRPERLGIERRAGSEEPRHGPLRERGRHVAAGVLRRARRDHRRGGRARRPGNRGCRPGGRPSRSGSHIRLPAK